MDASLRVPSLKGVYALGDAAATPDTKLAYMAKMQGFHVAKCIVAEISGKAPPAFKARRFPPARCADR